MQKQLMPALTGVAFTDGVCRGSELTYPIRREETRPTLNLEKLAPGGIADVSPWRCRVGEGKEAAC